MKNAHQPTAIVVTATGSDSYEVEVKSKTVTHHRVTASPAYLRELGVDAYPASRVIHEAFMFLLEHEPNTSILANFDLREIERYFPEFPVQIAGRLKR
jgi:hypothetical protein